VWGDAKLLSLPPRFHSVHPPNQSHFATTHVATVIQTQGTGSFKRVYVNPADDPSEEMTERSPIGGLDI
jgi:hypothetical protein